MYNDTSDSEYYNNNINNNDTTTQQNNNNTTTTMMLTTEYYMEHVYESIYTPTQLAILSWASFIPGLLSLIGSTTIAYTVLFVNPPSHTNNDTYHRLMFGLSICDILFSFGQVFFGPWTYPKEAYKMAVNANGSFVLCQVNGFFIMFIFGSMLYTAFLSVYFVMKVIWKFQDRFISWRVEPFFHLIAFGWGLFLAITFVVYDENVPQYRLPGWCTGGAYPPHCERRDDIECTRGTQISKTFVLLISSGSILLSFVIITICMILLVWKVRQTERRMKQYNNIGANNNENENENGRRSSIRRRSSINDSTRRTKQTTIMALSYIGCFFISFVWYILFQALDGKTSSTTMFWLALGVKVFTPLQGFFNAFIYLKKHPTVTTSSRGGGCCCWWCCCLSGNSMTNTNSRAFVSDR